MLPIKKEAIKLLEAGAEKNNGAWKNHSIIAANCAYKIASHCENLDKDKAYILALLHDIGRQEGFSYLKHTLDGYNFLMVLGYDEAARICITHSFPIKNTAHYIGEKDISDEELKTLQNLLAEYEYDDYDRLIQLCDCLALPESSTDIITRMSDVKTRYGFYPEEKWNKNLSLKKYFEGKTKLNLDNLHISIQDCCVPVTKRIYE